MIKHPVDSADAAELREAERAATTAAPGADPAPPRPRCDSCDPTRHVELPDGRLARCPHCHPAARLGRCPEPGCAFRWQDGTDRPCRMHLDLYATTKEATR